jgi:cysteine desulfurase
VVLPVRAQGTVELDAVDAALAERPAVVSVMWVNNETGVVQPVAEIAERCRAAGTLFHTDAVQAVGKVPVALAGIACTMLSLSGHKLGAPKGIGALIIRDRKAVEAIIHGGGQQHGLRPGTENVAGAVALGKAVQLAVGEQAAEALRLRTLRDRLAERLKATVSDLFVTAEEGTRAPHILNVAVAGAESEAMLMHLDIAGVAASGGSACSTGAVEPSHVLLALGVPPELASGSVRFSFGHGNTEADVDRVVEVMPGIVARVRKLAGVLGRA